MMHPMVNLLAFAKTMTWDGHQPLSTRQGQGPSLVTDGLRINSLLYFLITVASLGKRKMAYTIWVCLKIWFAEIL